MADPKGTKPKVDEFLQNDSKKNSRQNSDSSLPPIGKSTPAQTPPDSKKGSPRVSVSLPSLGGDSKKSSPRASVSGSTSPKNSTATMMKLGMASNLVRGDLDTPIPATGQMINKKNQDRVMEAANAVFNKFAAEIPEMVKNHIDSTPPYRSTMWPQYEPIHAATFPWKNLPAMKELQNDIMTAAKDFINSNKVGDVYFDAVWKDEKDFKNNFEKACEEKTQDFQDNRLVVPDKTSRQTKTIGLSDAAYQAEAEVGRQLNAQKAQKSGVAAPEQTEHVTLKKR